MFKFAIYFLIAFLSNNVMAQGVAVNMHGNAADSSAMLDVNADYKGMLIPRLNQQQRDSIHKPATALLIFNNEINRFQVNLGTGSTPNWKTIITLDDLKDTTGNGWLLGGNATITDTSYIGTSDKHSLSLKTNGVIRMYIDSVSGRIGINNAEPRATLDITATDAMIVPVGTTAQRPSSPVVGMIRFNTITGKLEGYTTQGWIALH